MSKQANTTVIGVFVVIAILLAVAAVVIFGSNRFFKASERYVLYFSGSVKGLSVGAPVVFRGVRIGTVADIKVRFEPAELSFVIPVVIEVTEGSIQNMGPDVQKMPDPEFMHKLINRGLRGQLELQSLVTGQLMVNLDLFPDKPAVFVSKGNHKIPGVSMEIPTIRTVQQKLTETLEEVPLGEIAKNVSDALAVIAKVVNSPGFAESFKEIHTTLTSVNKLANDVDRQVVPLSNALMATLNDTQKLLDDISSRIPAMSDSVKQIAAAAQAALKDTRELLDGLNQGTSPLGARLAEDLEALHQSLNQAGKTLKTYENLVADDSQLRYLLFNSLDEFTAMARSVRTLADYLEQHPDALLRGKGR